MMRAAEAAVQVDSPLDGKYEILAELSRGSFGRVYSARQLSTGQLVAVKVLQPERDGTDGDWEGRVQRFRGETRVCSELSHPNIVRLIDSGDTADGRLYAAFEFLPGSTLRELLATEGKLSVAEAVHLMAQILDALSCAHARGIVHRDLKPENIMITKTGARRNALVLDFGLGGLAGDAETQITAAPEVVGTLCYAAPEQLRGEPPSTRSDLYSWGLILLECLTGDPPVRGASTREVLMKQLGPEPVAIPQWLRNHSLSRVLEVVTAKRAEKRDISIEHLLEMLTTIGIGEFSDPSGPGTFADEGSVGPQRRQLTIVCCRLTISASNDRQMDVEKVDQFLRAQCAALAARAAQAGGTVAAILADRVLVTFGYPQAREGDARRAVRLALDIAGNKTVIDQAMTPPGNDVRVDVRVGVHAGIVLVRDLRNGIGSRVPELSGVTPQIASHLLERAKPGEVLVSFNTHRLLRYEFESEPAGECIMPGLSRLLPVFRIKGVRRGAGDAEGGTWIPDTPLVGRAPQFRQLLEGWEQTRAGHGSVMLLTGEPGIGKSRLLQELRQQCGTEAWLELTCAPENQTTALRPVIDALLAMEQSVEALLRPYDINLAENVPLFAALLSVPLDARYQPLHLSPEHQKELTLQALVSLLLKMAVHHPLVLAIENLHWADPTTLELVTLLIQTLRTARIGEVESRPKLYVVGTTRPEFIPRWTGEDITFLALQRLTTADVEEMVKASLSRGHDVPAALVDQVAQRAEGIPLFVEEITRVVLESVQAGSDTPDVSLSPWRIEIPGSLRDLLTARLDSVSPVAHDTAQLAAVLGREFRYEILQAVSQKDAGLLHQDMAELGRAGLLVHRRIGSGDGYTFRHALLRDAAYEALTRTTRQGLHRRVAHVLRQQFSDIERQRPEILALHHEQGGEVPVAVDYWSRAGTQSIRRAAFAEALSQLGRALALLPTLEASPENRQRELAVLVLLGTAQISTRGWAAPEVERTFGRAWDLCVESGGDPPVMIVYGVWGVRITRSDRAGVEAMLPLFRKLTAHSDALMAMLGHSALGVAAFWRGDFPAAHQYLEAALRYYGEQNLQSTYDTALDAYGMDFSALWALGYPDRARALRAEALAFAERRRDATSVATVLGWGAMLAHDCGDVELAHQWGERLMTIALEQRLLFWWAPGACMSGRALAIQGHTEEGIALIREALDRQRSLGIMCAYNYYLTFLSEAYASAGRIDEGLAAVDEGLSLCQTLVARFHEPELLRVRGQLLLQAGDATGAEDYFRRALVMAARDGARGYELRAAMDLARLLAAANLIGEARTALQGVYDQFTEGFDTRDLQTAKMLLATLAAGTLTQR